MNRLPADLVIHGLRTSVVRGRLGMYGVPSPQVALSMAFEHTTSRLADALLQVARVAERSTGGSQATRRPAFAAPAGDADGYPNLTIRHILVPLDGSAVAECALPFAAAVGKVLSARITLLRVLTAPTGHVDPVEWELARARGARPARTVRPRAHSRGLTSDVAVREGRPAEQIIHFAQEHHVDLIVLSSHGEGGLTSWVLSSTVQKVVARTHSSILIVPAYAAEAARRAELRLGRILVPLDCSPRAECILPFAVALARAHDADLVLAHVVPEPELPRRMPPSSEDVALARRLTERNRDREPELSAEPRERSLGAGHPGTDARRRRRRAGPIASSSSPIATTVDLIVACAHGATGNATDRYGSTVAHLIQWSNRPIVVLQDLAECRA